jgi:hypothetical protein
LNIDIIVIIKINIVLKSFYNEYRK